MAFAERLREEEKQAILWSFALKTTEYDGNP